MKDLEHDDPMELVGVGYATSITPDVDLTTARCLIEEYALAGFTAHEIGSLFVSPSYTLPHAILQRRGKEFVRKLIIEVFGGEK